MTDFSLTHSRDTLKAFEFKSWMEFITLKDLKTLLNRLWRHDFSELICDLVALFFSGNLKKERKNEMENF